MFGFGLFKLLICIFGLMVAVHSSSTTMPLGQHPSVVTSPSKESTFIVYNSAQGLSALFCNTQECQSTNSHVLKCNTHVLSTSVILADSTRAWNVTYWIVVGYRYSLHSDARYLSLFSCFDIRCQSHKETLIDHASPDLGFSTSISIQKNGMPMFVYTYKDVSLTRLRIIICKDIFCTRFVGDGKSSHTIQQNVPSLSMGTESSTNSVHGTTTISSLYGQHSPSILYYRWVANTTGSTTITADLVLANCIDWNCTEGLIKTTTLAKNIVPSVSMDSYVQQSKTNTNKSMAVDDTQLNNATWGILFAANTGRDLYLMMCFDRYCNQHTRINRTLVSAKSISYPKIAIDFASYSNKVIVAFFENGSYVSIIRCEAWNCDRYKPEQVYHNAQLITGLSQLSVFPAISTQIMTFSVVLNNATTEYAGLAYVWCTKADCSSSFTSLLDADNNPLKFHTEFQWLVFLISGSIMVYLAIFSIFIMCNFLDAEPFIAKYINNAHLQHMKLDRRVQSMSYWMFFAVLIGCAMCIVPWFAYFNFNMDLYQTMAIPPLLPIIITVFFVMTIRYQCQSIQGILILLSLLYFAAAILLCYSFTLVWSLVSNNCETEDLTGLRTVIIVGHIVTGLICLYLMLWCVRCCHAIYLSTPEQSIEYGWRWFGGMRGKRRTSLPTPVHPSSNRLVRYLDSGQNGPNSSLHSAMKTHLSSTRSLSPQGYRSYDNPDRDN